MKKIDKLKKKTNNFLYDHIHFKNGLSYFTSGVIVAIAALIYAFSFVCFVAPATSVDVTSLATSSVITGGVGGLAQVFHLILKVSGVDVDPKLLQSICYFAFNIPILLFAFFKVGKKFALISLINVGLSSLFIELLRGWDLAQQIAVEMASEHTARVLFAGALTGFTSAIAFKANASCGGIDVFSYYFAMRKSTNVGKYTMSLNTAIVIVYTILSIVAGNGAANHIAIINILFAILYTLTASLAIDFINTRNKKVQIQIITENPTLSAVLISNFPHSNTTVEGRGGYSHKDKTIIYVVVSSNEVKHVVDVCKKADPHSFITVTTLLQAYGNFFIKPVE